MRGINLFLLPVERARLFTINRSSLTVSLSALALVVACGSDKSSGSQSDTSSDSVSSTASSGSSSHAASSHAASSSSSSAATQTNAHTSSTTTRESDEPSDGDDTSNESSDDQDSSDDSTATTSTQTSGSASTTAVSTSAENDSGESDANTSATSESDATSTSDGSGTSAELSAYERLCSTCHGPTGDGVNALGPDIKHPVEDYSEWVIRNGRTGTTMVAFDSEALSDDELAEILEFLGSQEQPTTGEGLYVDYCAACHGDDGLGGPTMRPIVNEVQEAEELVRNGHGGSNFSDRREYMPQWSDAALSDAELDLIITYIESL